MSNPKIDVVIIGAGLSGLMAATELHRAGLSYVVLEAMDRVGGKTLTVAASSQGGHVDVGAAWINDTNQSCMYALAQKFGFDLKVQRAEGNAIFEDANGKLHEIKYGEVGVWDEKFFQDWADLSDVCDVYHPELGPGAKEWDGITFADFAKRYSPAAESLANALSKALLGAEATQMSALYMFHYIKSGTGLRNMVSDGKDGGQYLRNRQGNHSFSIRLAEELHPGAIHLSSPVKKISQQGGNRSTVEIANGRTYECKRVIVSVPSTLYSLIEFSPTLPRAKHDYAESTQLGMYAKTIFVYERPWWREHGLSGILDSVVGLISFSRDTCIEEDKQYSITCFIVGETGRRWSKLSAAARIQQVTNQLERAFQKRVQNVPQPINIIEQDWSKEPWIRGVPCPFTPPGVLTSDAGKAIRVPVGNLHFVGTETAFFWKGYMEGAVRSGTREAAEVIEVLAPEKTEAS